MAKRSIVPFGPQHPVLPEPVHLDLVLEDETVVGAIPSIGFIHRGLEKLVEKKDFKQYVYIAERVCGICSVGHGMGYCESVEHIMGVEVPARADYLRTIWMELSRLHSHLLWLGLLADAMGFESLFMDSWRIREKVLSMFEKTTGSRLILSVYQGRMVIYYNISYPFLHKDGGISLNQFNGICSLQDNTSHQQTQGNYDFSHIRYCLKISILHLFLRIFKINPTNAHPCIPQTFNEFPKSF